MQKITYHRDGMVTYWSCYLQTWVRRAATVPDAEIAAMPEHQRVRVIRHTNR